MSLLFKSSPTYTLHFPFFSAFYSVLPQRAEICQKPSSHPHNRGRAKAGQITPLFSIPAPRSGVHSADLEWFGLDCLRLPCTPQYTQCSVQCFCCLFLIPHLLLQFSLLCLIRNFRPCYFFGTHSVYLDIITYSGLPVWHCRISICWRSYSHLYSF